MWELARLADTLAGALDLHLDPELITTPEDAPHIVWNRLDDAFRNDARRAELLRDARPYDEALQRLETLPSAELERLLTETLDVCSHRIDAWETSLYAERLKQMRVRRPRGCHLGAWGVVENVRRREAFEAQTAGYIHAPSLDHAATAAILLNAHRTYVGEDAERFRIDLSSARVRDALEVLAAVRAGQRFDDAVARVTAGDAARGQSARDAIGDLLTAESVFQIVRGNPAAGGASLDALGKGHRPPEPEVVRSGRGGAAVTHRVMLGFESQSSAMGAWRSPRAGPRPLGG